MEDLLTTKQLQDLLQVDRVTIYRMLQEGRLEGFKVGGQWRFSRQAIQRWLRNKQASRGAGPPEAALATLAPDAVAGPALLSLSCMQALQDIFAEALEISALITSIDDVPLTAISRPCAFCQCILDTEVGLRRCGASWQAARMARAAGPPARPATCHAGLNYLSAPIRVQGKVPGVIHVGQFLAGPNGADPAWRQRLAGLAAATGVPLEDLLRATSAVPRLEEQRLPQVSRILQRVADTLAAMAEERLALLGRLQRIAELSQVPAS